ncbi:hypothetical protein PASLES2_20555 [Pseudomonas aeruginosa]|uniref:hypothetical protein n=1 Tax=Pseudomonas aeruginosa TaxID=287 RepID=UPI0032E952BE
MEEPIMRWRDRVPTIKCVAISPKACNRQTCRPPSASSCNPSSTGCSSGYRIEQAGSIEESGKASKAMLPLFPIMLAVTLIIIILQVRSIAAMIMVLLTSPLGLIGVVPTLILFQQRSASTRWSG